ncbi:MAG: hypothetical protein ACRDYV_08670, partial [Acidimicrobiia bacterium]
MRVDIGRQDAGYGYVLAVAMRQLLRDIPPELASAPVLVGQVASTSVPRVYANRTRHAPLFVFDPRDEHVEAQREMLSAGRPVRLLQCDVTDLPGEVDDLACVVNPFGLQEFPDRVIEYGTEVRRRVRTAGFLQTLDWGLTGYP